MILSAGAAWATGREVVSALGRPNEVFDAGRAAEVTDDVRRVARGEPVTFDRFARDEAGAFRGV